MGPLTVTNYGVHRSHNLGEIVSFSGAIGYIGKFGPIMEAS